MMQGTDEHSRSILGKDMENVFDGSPFSMSFQAMAPEKAPGRWVLGRPSDYAFDIFRARIECLDNLVTVLLKIACSTRGSMLVQSISEARYSHCPQTKHSDVKSCASYIREVSGTKSGNWSYER